IRSSIISASGLHSFVKKFAIRRPEADMMEDLMSMMKKMIERRYFNGGSRCRWWFLSYWIEDVDRRLRGRDNYVCV
nr:hypothetical protein [Tanacetum cinerariifolium]